MIKIAKYITVGGHSGNELDEAVNEKIGEGFQPYGNPYLSDREVEGNVEGFVIFQAMVIYH